MLVKAGESVHLLACLCNSRSLVQKVLECVWECVSLSKFFGKLLFVSLPSDAASVSVNQAVNLTMSEWSLRKRKITSRPEPRPPFAVTVKCFQEFSFNSLSLLQLALRKRSEDGFAILLSALIFFQVCRARRRKMSKRYKGHHVTYLLVGRKKLSVTLTAEVGGEVFITNLESCFLSRQRV